MACARVKRAPRGRLRLHEPLAKHTVWGIGGPAERFYEPADVDDLCEFLAALPASEPLFWLGLGSNVLVRDGGLRGTVVSIAAGLNALQRIGERGVRAEAGVACPKVARFAAKAGLGGSEFLAGIPGTVGGALAMNAGAFGGETYDIVRHIEMVDRQGRRHLHDPSALCAGYRHVEVPLGQWFVAAEFTLDVRVTDEAQDRIRELLKQRAASQPTGQRSCGSVFRNPPGDHAARLIEACGLKGRRIGDAVVSEKHANFIINDGAARATDVEALIDLVRNTVHERHGVLMMPEVRIVGEAA